MTPDPRDGDPLRPPDPEPAPVDPIRHWIPSAAENPGCGTLLAIIGSVVLAILVAAPTAPAAPSEGPDASVTVKGYADVPVLRGAPLAPPSLPVVVARPQLSRARESAPVTTPSPDTAIVHRGVASHMGDSPDAGPRYLALPIGPGHRVRLCGEAACLTLTSTDAGPALFMQRRGRVADLSVELFEMLTGRPASRGLAPVSWKGME